MKVTLVVFSGDMDKAMAAFNIAIGAGAMGMDASMFFTFWGIHILKRPGAPSKSKGFIKKMLSAMSRLALTSFLFQSSTCSGWVR